MNIKDTMRYCERLGCTYDKNIQYCCPEMMSTLCLKKDQLLKDNDYKLYKKAHSKSEKVQEQIFELFDKKLGCRR